jgi:hypothetical protein
MKRIMILALLAFGLAVFALGKNASEKLQADYRKQPSVQASANPASLDFGDQEVQTISKQLRIALTNGTGKPIEIRGVDTEGHWQDFEVDDDGCTGVPIEAGKSCSIGIIFSPAGVGPRSSFLLITYDDPDHPQKIPLKGNGIKPSSVTLSAKFKPFQ